MTINQKHYVKPTLNKQMKTIIPRPISSSWLEASLRRADKHCWIKILRKHLVLQIRDC